MEGESWRKLPSVTTFCRGERKRAAPLQGRPYGQTNEEDVYKRQVQGRIGNLGNVKELEGGTAQVRTLGQSIMCNNGFFGGCNSCSWIIILIIILLCCCGGNSYNNGGCNDGCGNGCGCGC